MSNSIFPSGVDTFIDPGPNTPQNAAQPHHLMHSVANDAIVAMEHALLQQFVPFAASITPDASLGNVIVIGTLTDNTLIQAPTNAASYSVPLVFVFTQDSTGGRAVTWNPAFVTTWAPDPTANASSAIGFIYKLSSATWIPVHAFPDQISITTVSGNLGILGNLTVSGEGFFSGTLNTAGITDTLGITTNGVLTSRGLTVSSGGGNITGNLSVNGSITATGSNGKVTANSGLIVNSGGANVVGNSLVTGTFRATSSVTGTTVIASGLSGSTDASRYVGATTSGAPLTGTFVVGDFVIDHTGKMWVCITAGSPGIWDAVGSSIGGEISATDFRATGLTGATGASRYAGGIISGQPVSGTFAVGDFVIDHTGVLWICTIAGSPGTWMPVGSKSNPAGRMYQTSQNVIGLTTWVTISNMTQDYVYGGVTFSSANNALTIPITGLYRVSYQIQWQNTTAPPAAGQYAAGVTTNGASGVYRQNQCWGDGSKVYPSPGGSDIITLNAGDYVQLMGYQNSVGLQGTVGAFPYTFLSLDLISK